MFCARAPGGVRQPDPALKPAPCGALNALLQAADRALYRAKAAGRHRIELADRTCGPTGGDPQPGAGAQAGCWNEAGCDPYGTQREPGAACTQADCSCASAYS